MNAKLFSGFLIAALVVIGGTAQAGSNWESYGMNVPHGKEGDVLAAIEKFMACIEEMENLQGQDRPDFILMTGDIHISTLEPYLEKINIPQKILNSLDFSKMSS